MLVPSDVKCDTKWFLELRHKLLQMHVLPIITEKGKFYCQKMTREDALEARLQVVASNSTMISDFNYENDLCKYLESFELPSLPEGYKRISGDKPFAGILFVCAGIAVCIDDSPTKWKLI